MAAIRSALTRVGAKVRGNKPTDTYMRPPDAEQEQSVLNWVQDKISRARRRDYPWHSLYYLAMANVVGRQWATFNPRRRVLEEPVVPSNKILLTLNQILPMVLREASKLSLGRVPWSVVPTSQDDEALAAARMDGKLLEHYWETHNMRKIETLGNLTRTMWGMCFFEPYWNTTSGRLLGQTGRLPEYEGDVDVNLVTPFQIAHDPDATCMEELRWIATTRMMDVGKLRQIYERGDEVVPEQPDEHTYLEHRLQYLSSHYFQAFTSRGDVDRFPNHARYVKYWFYPDDEYPQGREIHTAGNVVLYDDKWQNEYLTSGKMRHPLIPLNYTQLPGRFRAMGMVENLLEPQWEYNKKRSQLVMILNAMAKPKWLASKNHQLAYAPNDEAGEFIEYNTDPLSPGTMPTPVLPNLPTGDFEAILNRTLSDMQNTASQHEVSYGRTPPGVEAGVAIEQLIAQDDAAKGLPVQDSIVAFQELGSAILGLYRQYGKEEMLIGIAGRDYKHEYFTWKKTASDPEARVMVISDGSMPLTRGQKREMVKELIALQILDPLADRNKILQYLEFGQLEEAFHRLNVDVLNAKRENRQMIDTDTVPEVFPEDDHEVHVIEHTEALKARRDIDPMAAARMRTHVSMHLFHKGMVQTQTANLAASGGQSLDQVANRTGDEVDREVPNDPYQQGQMAPDRGQTRPESGTVGKKKEGTSGNNGKNQSGTPGNKMDERKQKENQ